MIASGICANNYTLSPWSEWTVCNVSCGGYGTQRRYRVFRDCCSNQVLQEPRDCGSDACPGFKLQQSDEAYSVSVSEPKFSLLSTDHGTSHLVKLVSFVMDNETQGPITVVSSDSAVLCGVFCAVYNVIQQLSVDDEVDIFSAVRQLQIRRPELCSILEEYIMIHTAVLEYIRLQQDQTEEII
ncbi:receptor-type tyrosine-protein phosphatase alpha-like [Saccostrea cucullata]|uniref:receptor-type tyrosine-protein phosphatase alpha-like n=1 Tax=Saccostrea cuccullata TaxID=36930 RepID=UPI002ED61C37